MDAEAGPMCKVASADAGSPSYLLVSTPLPFVVDTKFFASGYQGDYSLIHAGLGLALTDAGKADATCGGDRAVPSAPAGGCYKWTYDNMPAGTATNDAGGKAVGYGAVEYQSLAPSMNYNANFGSDSGIIIPPGATMVSFWAKGAVGGEVVGFGLGQISGKVCNDSIIIQPANETLTTTWTHYTIPFPAGQSYANGQIIGFNWSATAQTSGDAGTDAGASPITFFIDNIEWVGPTPDGGSMDGSTDSETDATDAAGQ
jgi:hypothetical protein